jgi:hypothetical protein
MHRVLEFPRKGTLFALALKDLPSHITAVRSPLRLATGHIPKKFRLLRVPVGFA